MSLKTYINPDAIAGDSINYSKISNFKSKGYIDLHGHTLTVGDNFIDKSNGDVSVYGSAYMGLGVKIGTDIFNNEIVIAPDVEIHKGVKIGSDLENSNNISIGKNVNICDGVSVGVNNNTLTDDVTVAIGSNVYISDSIFIGTNGQKSGIKTQLGEGVYIYDCVIGTSSYGVDASVKIGNDVYIAQTQNAATNSENAVYIGTKVNIGGNVAIQGDVDIMSSLKISTINKNDNEYLSFTWKKGTENKEKIFSEKTEISINGSSTNLIVNKTLSPNVYYKLSNVAKANISFANKITGEMNNYMFQIDVVSSNAIPEPSIKLPEDIKWANGNEPNFEAGITYQISVINNLGVFTEFY